MEWMTLANASTINILIHLDIHTSNILWYIILFQIKKILKSWCKIKEGKGLTEASLEFEFLEFP